MSDDDMKIYQLLSHQLEVPIVLVQDFIASLESADLKQIAESDL